MVEGNHKHQTNLLVAQCRLNEEVAFIEIHPLLRGLVQGRDLELVPVGVTVIGAAFSHKDFGPLVAQKNSVRELLKSAVDDPVSHRAQCLGNSIHIEQFLPFELPTFRELSFEALDDSSRKRLLRSLL